MLFARISAVAIAAVIALLVMRGASNWSASFTALWYGLFALGVVAALVALGVALVGRGPARRRLLMVALALPALLAVGLFVWLLATLPFS